MHLCATGLTGICTNSSPRAWACPGRVASNIRNAAPTPLVTEQPRSGFRWLSPEEVNSVAKDLRQIRVVWSGLPGTPYLSQFHFEYIPAKEDAAMVAVSAFLQSCQTSIALGLLGHIEPDQNIIDAASGQIEAIETSTAGLDRTGSNATETLPPATQGVVRLSTDNVLNGRRVRGRLFIPSPCEGSSNGAPVAAYLNAVGGAASTLLTSSGAFGLWAVFSRPRAATATAGARAGTWSEIRSTSVWNKWGVQRRRRD